MGVFKEYIKSFGDKHINIYIDMDGVVTDYDFEGYENDGTNSDIYRYKRPVMSSIEPLKESANSFIRLSSNSTFSSPSKKSSGNISLSFIFSRNL